MAKDLLLSDSHDLVISGFDLQLTNETSNLKQLLQQQLMTFKGDWFLNIDKGIPYYQEILGQRNSIDAVRAIFIEAINAVDGVKEIIELELNLDSKNRSLDVRFSVLDEFSNVVDVII